MPSSRGDGNYRAKVSPCALAAGYAKELMHCDGAF